jgi:hypothetical protein
MGYRGLLLNDPYKIDRMMGCVCGFLSYLTRFSVCFIFQVGYINQRIKWDVSPKIGITIVLEGMGVFKI